MNFFKNIGTSIKNFLKEKDEKSINKLVMLFLVGIALLVISSVFMKPSEQKTQPETEDEAIIKMPETDSGYEEKVEAKLEEILSMADGAGKVKVMVTLVQGKETVVKEDSKTSESMTDESDGSGGDRKISDKTSESNTVMIRQKDGSEIPLVLVETEPRVEGVIIISEGGGNVIVKDALIRATQTVLGIEAHKVQVLKMKN